MALVMATAGSAGAWGLMPRRWEWRPDDWAHSWCMANVPASNQPRYSQAMASLDAWTNMSTSSQPCSSSTDVVFIEQPIGGFTRGITACTAPVAVSPSLSRCQSHWSTIDVNQILADTPPGQSLANVDLNIHKTIRHELGHTVGFDHTGQSDWTTHSTWGAMVSGWVPTSLNYLAWMQHQVDHLNAGETFQ